jgi:hypothetical protein
MSFLCLMLSAVKLMLPSQSTPLSLWKVGWRGGCWRCLITGRYPHTSTLFCRSLVSNGFFKGKKMFLFCENEHWSILIFNGPSQYLVVWCCTLWMNILTHKTFKEYDTYFSPIYWCVCWDARVLLLAAQSPWSLFWFVW